MKKIVWGCALTLFLLCGCSREAAPAPEESLGEEAAEKKEIVLVATDDIENTLQAFITQYNQQSEDYYITYEEESMVSRLNARLVSGNSPDLVIINYNLFQVYLEAEALEDIGPYLRESSVLKREDYLENVITSFEKDGKLYGIPVEFSVQTLLACGSGTRKGQEWEIEDFLEYLETNPDIVFEWSGNDFEILKFCLQYGIDRFVDYDTGTCRFDSEEFAELLCRTEKLGEMISRESRPWYEVVEDGGTMIAEQSINSFTSFMTASIEYETEVKHLGYPGADGIPRCRLLPENAIGLAANSQNKDAAWEIAEQYLRYQFNLYGFPAVRRNFEEMLREATTQQYIVLEDGSRKEQPLSYYGGEPIYALTKEQADEVLAVIDEALPDEAVRDRVRQLVLEEAASYFSGQKTLEEAQQLAQSRAQVYLSEQL